MLPRVVHVSTQNTASGVVVRINSFVDKYYCTIYGKYLTVPLKPGNVSFIIYLLLHKDLRSEICLHLPSMLQSYKGD